MNCPSCGAAMRFVDGRGYFVCDYCTTFHFPQQQPAAADRVPLLNEASEHPCPVCGVLLVQAALEGHRILHCERCRGILVSNASFADIVRVRRARHEGPPDRPVPLDPDALGRQVRCPVCQGRMDVHPYYGPGNVVIDTCAPCSLIWLDHGELGVIERAPGRGRAADIE